MFWVVVPAYWLYGEQENGRFPDALHVETIVWRSQRHRWRIKAHRHPDMLQIFIVVEGGGRASIDGAAHDLGPGTAISIPPFVIHGFDFDAGTNGYVASIPEATLKRILLPELPIVALHMSPTILKQEPSGPAFSTLKRQMQMAHEEFVGNQLGRDATLTAHAELIALSFARSADHKTSAMIDAHNPGVKLVKRFIERVETDFARHKSVKEYAQELGISPTHLRRTCSAILGYPALKVIHDRLLIEARRKLIYTARPVSRIAFELGFEDAAYFTRFFTERVGESPSQYRARMDKSAGWRN
jgi:AraC family transcriptional activator of pobA